MEIWKDRECEKTNQDKIYVISEIIYMRFMFFLYKKNGMIGNKKSIGSRW